MAGSRALRVIRVVAFVAAVLAFGATRSAGADYVTQTLVGSNAANAATATSCMTCHGARGSVSQIQQLTHAGRNLRPAWSPDGQKVAFYSNRTGNDDIWVVSLDTGDETQLTTDPASDRRPNWSPDGNWIAFDSDRSGSRDIWLIRADGSEPKQLTSGSREDLFASWSPDGQTIAYFSYASGTNELWVIDADGSNPRPVLAEVASEQARQCSFACHQPAWNASGEKLAFHSEQSGNRDIWVVNVDGTELTRLTTDPDEDYFPSWTPDGRIVFMTERIGAEKVWNDVRVISLDGSQTTTLFTDIAHGGPFYWSPEGNRIALHSQLAGDNFNVFVATIGEPPGEAPAAGAEEAPPPAREAEELRAEEVPAQTALWRAWLGAVAAIAVVVAIIGLGVIGVYLWRAAG